METIHYWVELLCRLWLCMLLLFFALGGYRPTKDDRASQLFIIATLSSVLPVIQNSGRIGTPGLGEFSWGFPWVSYCGFGVFSSVWR